MNISIFGLGYVGCVGIACLADLGHNVIGVDLNENKVNLINQGRPTIIEKDIEELCRKGHDAGRISATTDYDYAVKNTDISFIAVGTPSAPNGELNLDYIFNVAKQIGEALRDKDKFHTIAIRSTVVPGTNQKVGEIIEEISGKKRGMDFTVVSNPEFLREGSAVKDFLNPPLTLIGAESKEAEDIMRDVYKGLSAEFVVADIKVAEIMKYVNNTYHALKIVFANEVGNICKALGIDSHVVMDIFCKDKHLNISPYYFKPGFAYGGSCLPKDTRALCTLAKNMDIDAPMINSIEESNDIQKQNAINLVMDQDAKHIGILGLSFKAGTDDLRCSPVIDLVESLLNADYDLSIYDKNVKVSQMTGTNHDFINATIPHLQELISDNLDEVISKSDVLVVCNKEPEFEDIIVKYPTKRIIDLVRMWKNVDNDTQYEGLSWVISRK